jgi:hypothetical protein
MLSTRLPITDGGLGQSSPIWVRLLLAKISFIGKMLRAIFISGMLLSLASLTYAQNQPKSEAVFIGVKKTDRVGHHAAQPDGTPDAVFTLNLKPTRGEPNIAEIEIRTLAGPSGLWSSGRPGSEVGYLGIARAKNPSELLNLRREALKIDPAEDSSLLLFLTDDGQFQNKSRRYQVRIIHADGTAVTLPVKVQITPGEDAPAPQGAYPVRMTAVLKGISNYDAVSSEKNIASDDKADGLFVLRVEATDKTITGIEIRNVDGTPSVWDTIPGTRNGAIGVALTSEPVKLLNNRDSTVSIPVQKPLELNLYVGDNGSIAEGKTNYRVSVTFSDGGLSWCPVQKNAAASEEPKPSPEAAPSKNVNFMATLLGFVTTDAVGQYPGIKPDGVADAVFGLDIETTPKSEIIGIEIQSVDGPTRRWSTYPVPGAWGLGVAYQSAQSTLLNKPDGGIRIPLERRAQFFVYAADPGDLATSNQQLLMIAHLEDGSSYQQPIRRPVGTTPSVVPGTEDPYRVKGAINCEFRGFLYDLVSASTKPGKDGYLDGLFILKIQADEQKIAKVDISGPDKVVHWSSDPKSPVMYLGVAIYPKFRECINKKPGSLNLELAGRKTLYLYAADNGMLSDPKAHLFVTVWFTDKTSLSGQIIK